MTRPILLTGFGPFLQVSNNPSGALVRALNGSFIGERVIVGYTLPVSFERAPQLTLRMAKALDAALILGFGVATTRSEVQVERLGRIARPKQPDVDGNTPAAPTTGPSEVPATLNVNRLAAYLEGTVSEDAGTYVCNAWAWSVPQYSSSPAAFVHIPPTSIHPSRVLSAIRSLLTEQ